MLLAPGQVLDGKYRIVKVIGEGGMGAVYEGENTRIRRRVAIKVLHAGVASNMEMVQRFEREAQVAGTVGNDHILEILDLGALATGERYMVMEFLDGETLTDRIKSRGRLQPQDAVGLVRQVLRGLAAAHAAGIVHRDLKPDNIFILKEKAGTRDFAKIIDFGISKFSEQGQTSRMTRTGALMGTPHYMAPEQATGSSEIDKRTDIYAMGIILYEAVTGRVPFQAETFNQLLFEIALAKITPASQVAPGLDPAIDTIIMKASARDPAHRFQTAAEFTQALDEWQQTGRSVSLPPEQSIEAIVAATVPRTGQMPSIPTGSVPGVPTLADPRKPGDSVATRRSSPGSIPGDSVVNTEVSGGVSPAQPTLNTWANSQATAPKSTAPVLVATVLGMLLLVGGGTAAYFVVRGSPEPAHAAGSAEPATKSAVPSPPAAATATADTPAAEPGAATGAAQAPAAPSAAAPTVAPAAPAAKAAPRSALHGQAKPPAKPGKPEPAKPAAPTPTPQKKGPINFGY